MRKIYLDLGTHYGEGMREFIEMYKIDESWEIFTFEANPNTHKRFISEYIQLTPNVKSFNRAIYTHNDSHIFNFENYEPHNEMQTGMGSSLFDVIPRVFGQSFVSGEVSCIDISEFIRDNFNKDDFILVKMDIEGAEYPVLEKMLEEGTLNYINDLYVEWHFFGFQDSEQDLINLHLSMKERIKPLVEKLVDWK